MFDYVKKAFRNYWLLSIFCVVVGIVLIINPGIFTAVLGYTIGGFLTLYGIIKLVMYFTKREEYPTNLVSGIILDAAGIFIMVKPDFIPKVIALIFGIYMIISGVVSIQDSLNLKNSGDEQWKISGIPAIITTIVGIIMVFNPLAPVNVAVMILGIALLVSGITNIIGCCTANSKLRKFEKLEKSNRYDKDDFIDI